MRLEKELRRNLILEIALIAFFLGICFMFGITLIFHSLWYTNMVEEYAAGLYIICTMVFFHMSEFITAASMRRHDTHPDAFMLYHSKEYMIANSAAWLEFFVEWLIIPETWKLMRGSYLEWIFRLNFTNVTIFAILTSIFYSIRVIGVIHCNSNFSLTIEHERRSSHVLVDNGIYSIFRHPAYFGFFWKTFFSQLLLANPLCFIIHTLITWKFFKDRIPYEEKLLESEEFFGDKYKAYKVNTWIGIPFIH